MSNQLIECVPNFSEGRDLSIIKQITDQIEATEGATLLDVDPGQATNRTVVTLVGAPDAVLNAAVAAVKKPVAVRKAELMSALTIRTLRNPNRLMIGAAVAFMRIAPAEAANVIVPD